MNRNASLKRCDRQLPYHDSIFRLLLIHVYMQTGWLAPLNTRVIIIETRHVSTDWNYAFISHRLYCETHNGLILFICTRTCGFRGQPFNREVKTKGKATRIIFYASVCQFKLISLFIHLMPTPIFYFPIAEFRVWFGRRLSLCTRGVCAVDYLTDIWALQFNAVSEIEVEITWHRYH